MTVLVGTREAAKFLGIERGTLSVWRCTRRYDLPWIKVGGSVKYRLADLENFIESRVRGTRGEAIPGKGDESDGVHKR